MLFLSTDRQNRQGRRAKRCKRFDVVGMSAGRLDGWAGERVWVEICKSEGSNQNPEELP